jgi:hypothetical protein
MYHYRMQINWAFFKKRKLILVSIAGLETQNVPRPTFNAVKSHLRYDDVWNSKMDISSDTSAFYSGGCGSNLDKNKTPTSLFVVFLSPLIKWPIITSESFHECKHNNKFCEEILNNEVTRILQPRVSRPVCLGVRHLSGTRDHFFFLFLIIFRQLQVFLYTVSSLTRRQVSSFQLLLVLVSAAFLGSEFREIHAQILMSQFYDSLILVGHIPVFISPRNRVAQLYLRPLD